MIIPDKKVIDARMSFCSSCDKTEDMSKDPLYFFVNSLGELIEDAPKTRCTECLCPVWVKVRFVSNSCPLNKWEE